mgnify:CR=1 FL=1
MQPEYWHDRWQRGDTGWHRDGVMPLLQKHWPVLGPQPDEQVLVPLCGKTLDMPWLWLVMLKLTTDKKSF